MTKPLLFIREELRELVTEMEAARSLALPSQQDDAMLRLRELSARVMQRGGAQRILELVEHLMRQGFD